MKLKIPKVPMGLSPYDYSTDANRLRYHLHTMMASMNPKGFRTPSKDAEKNKGYRINRIAEAIAAS